MNILVYSEFTADNIKNNLGAPDYSYYFVMRDFLPVLQAIGNVQLISDPAREADELFEASRRENRPCVLFSFAPPQKTILGLKCPTVPVFAWEFDSIPSEPWLGDNRQNWRYVFERCPATITHSNFTVNAVKDAMGDNFLVTSIPSPVWDKFAVAREARKNLPGIMTGASELVIESGVLIDTHDLSLKAFLPNETAVERSVKAAREVQVSSSPSTHTQSTSPFVIRINRKSYRTQSRWQITRRYLIELLLQSYRKMKVPPPDARVPAAEASGERMEPSNPVEPKALGKTGNEPEMPTWHYQRHVTTLTGIVFTSLFNPYDGRKNWVDMLTAFCTAFRDIPDATLVFKLGHQDYQSAINDMLMCMARMPKFRCRLVIIQGYLENESFTTLVRNTHFVLNASHGEGQCLPLMEFMSCGVPAVAPNNSAMLDYLDSDVGFVVNNWKDATAWSHDPRLAYRTLRSQIDWESLVNCLKDAYQCARYDRDRYLQMSANAIERMQRHCSREIAQMRLTAFINKMTESMP